MIRVISVVSLVTLLVLVLYLPSAYPPERFVAQLRLEHEQTANAWSLQQAEQVLVRTLDAQAWPGELRPSAAPQPYQVPAAVGSAVGNEMLAVNARLFNSEYFRSIDALLLLASYRAFTLLQWLPWLAAFCLAAILDGIIARRIKAKQLVHHSPELFALSTSLLILLACGTVIALVLPVALPPLLLPLVPICMAVTAAHAIRNFHSRGQ